MKKGKRSWCGDNTQCFKYIDFDDQSPWK